MRKVIPILIALLLLGACGHKNKPVPQTEDLGAPQIATSLDDAGLPVDKSDQITAIDAATGDASGMPHDGGAAIVHPKAGSQKSTEADDAPPADAPPLVAPAAPTIAPPATAPAPAQSPN
ncbi:hypothetical protein SAMN05444678_1127 [Sphingomonas sp. YR710]|uniref:hypothetical protein n=1 Tax=Sphingomonas sp. YR710 TaxID=1882773 RepID=UPI000888E688|nr:hypothetical protein [Sphingomonas sp. YR710]SDD33372.1 hypothetical protein SAMN05444678_1127 [Sphingomonas sp. YR710]